MTRNINAMEPISVETAMRKCSGPVVGHIAHVHQVVGDVGGELPGLMVVKKAKGELLHMGVELGAQVGLDVQSQSLPPVAHDVFERGVHKIDAHEDGAGGQDQPPVPGGQERVHDMAHRERKEQPQQSRRHRTGEVQKN